MSNEGKNLETIALHAGWRADATTGSVAVPIHQTTSYQFESTEKAADLFALAELELEIILLPLLIYMEVLTTSSKTIYPKWVLKLDSLIQQIL